MSQSIIRAAHSSIEDREARIKGLSFPELARDGHRFSCFRSLTPIFLRCFTSSLRLVDENSPAIRRMRTRTRTRTRVRVRICTDGGEGGEGRPEASSSSLSSTSLRSLKESKGGNDGEDGEQGQGSEENSQDGDEDVGEKTVAGWLPEGWEGYWDEHTDSPYYFNTRTGETQWDAPESEETNPLAEEGDVGGIDSSNGDPNIATSRSAHAESTRSACSTRAGNIGGGGGTRARVSTLSPMAAQQAGCSGLGRDPVSIALNATKRLGSLCQGLRAGHGGGGGGRYLREVDLPELGKASERGAEGGSDAGRLGV